MRLSLLQRQKVIRLKDSEFSYNQIKTRLYAEDEADITCRSLSKIVKLHRETGMLRKAYVQPRRKISEEIIGVINEAIRENPVYTARYLVRVTSDHGLTISGSHMARIR